jgi:polygalacturonase
MKRTALYLFLISLFLFPFNRSEAQNKKELPKVLQPSFKKDSFLITSYGAIGDGITLNTASINKAIQACSSNGGGVVVVPAGLWLTGPIELKNNVNLFIDKNAILQFSKDLNQYPLVKGNWEGVEQMRNQSPIYANHVSNIAITGSGIIDGNGDAWRMVKRDKLNETQWKKLISSGGVLSDDQKTWYPSEKSLKGSKIKNPGVIEPTKTNSYYNDIKDFLRPNMVVLNDCKKILLQGVTFQNSPAWCLHPLMCDNLTIRNIYAKNPWYAQNGDGIDIESCKNVLLEGSTFDVGDDGICIKSGRDEAGRKRGLPTENLLVRNCKVYHAHGGFVIGSEMSGGARNIFVTHCSFIGTDIGLRFKTARGRGGIVENIYVDNIVMKDIVGEAILFDMYYAAQDPIVLAGEKRTAPKVETLPVNEGTPVFRDFFIHDIVCNGAEKAVFIRGLPEMPVKNIVLENATIQSSNGIEVGEASGIVFRNIRLYCTKTDPIVDVHDSHDIQFDKLVYRDSMNVMRTYHAFSQKPTSFKKIIVDPNGNGDFKTIQDAINSLPDSSSTSRIIFIKNGIYKEKLFITKHNILFEGENRDSTIITQDIARDEWRCEHADDWGVATMNVDGNDITLKNLTIENGYGFHHAESREVFCAADTTHHKKIIAVNGHQMALRTMKATRLKAINCHFKAYAGDTVSPWNVESGMFYFKDCFMEGGVDFYCPRGWAYAEHCRFYANTGDASIWHDGSNHSDEKTVLKDCSFDGYKGFRLGRYHREAQFVLINCTFSENMSDTDIYFVPGNTLKWGRRVYFSNCHRKGGDYSWFRDNLNESPFHLNGNEINAGWVFKNEWHPENTAP